jgi:hypothetical protein
MHSVKKRRDSGFVVSLELVFIATCMLCVVLVAWASFGTKIVAEFGDIGAAVGSLNQSYTITGVAIFHPNDPNHPTDVATWTGSSFHDAPDFCDEGGACGVRFCVPPEPEAPPI